MGQIFHGFLVFHNFDLVCFDDKNVICRLRNVLDIKERYISTHVVIIAVVTEVA